MHFQERDSREFEIYLIMSHIYFLIEYDVSAKNSFVVSTSQDEWSDKVEFVPRSCLAKARCLFPEPDIEDENSWGDGIVDRDCELFKV